MSSIHAQPEHSDPSWTDRKPWVIMRADKYFVCGTCGTLVEIPAEAVGQLVIAAEQPPQEKQEVETLPPPEPVAERPAPEVPPPKPVQLTKRRTFTGETIDGLRVPGGKQLNHALAWVSFHLKVLGLQGTEKKRLLKLRKKHQQRQSCAPSTTHFDDKPARHAKQKPSPQRVPSTSPNRPAAMHPVQNRRSREARRHAHPGMSMAPKRKPPTARRGTAAQAGSRRGRSKKGRGPPG